LFPDSVMFGGLISWLTRNHAKTVSADKSTLFDH
jgi:hypothetical protein